MEGESGHISKRPRLVRNNTEVDEPQPFEDLEFQILQGYREFDNEVNKDRVAVARTGDISVAVERLRAVDGLFQQTSSLKSNRNSLLAQDSRAVLSISELAQISIRNLKLNESRKMLNVEDVINGAKKYMLKDYFRANSILEERIPHDLNEHAIESEEDTNNASGNSFKQRETERSFLQQFSKYDEFHQFNWFRMGALFQNLSKCPPTVDHMLGPLAVEKKTRAPITRRVREVVGAATTAEKITKETLNADQAETTPEQVKRCFKLFVKKNGSKQINLFKFVINPNSFARSIENLFYTSFLIKEGKFVLEEDEEGFPAIRPKEGLPSDPRLREIEIQRRNDAHQNHIIFQMDMPTWKKLIERFDIREPFLPD